MMLYEQLYSFESLYKAFLHARKGKRKFEETAAFERNLEPEPFKIQDELRSQIYMPGGYYSFYRTEAKRRLVSAAPMFAALLLVFTSNIGESHAPIHSLYP